MELYEELYAIQQHLQQAFGSTLLFVSVYDLFTITFSVYYVFYANFRVCNAVGHRHVITADFIIFELPMVLKDIYFVVYFHRLGERVSLVISVCYQNFGRPEGVPLVYLL